MKTLMTVIAFVGAVVCYRDLEDIIVDVVADTDINPTDGIISMDELRDFIGLFDDNADSVVTKHEFTTNWTNTYGDDHADTNTFFTNLDHNGDHVLTEHDLILHVNPSTGQMDGNNDGIVTVEEFSQFIRVPFEIQQHILYMSENKMHPGHGNH